MGGFALFEDGIYMHTLEDSDKDEEAIQEKIRGQIEFQKWVGDSLIQYVFAKLDTTEQQRERTEQSPQESGPDDHSPSADPPDCEDRIQATDGPQSENSLPSGECTCLLEVLIQRKYIEITEDEITAKSKRDFLTELSDKLLGSSFNVSHV
ncbi:hypothetical protein K435DRAFT_871551 [Dendrothele bispora CBS 962.96]|uniref:Uncharacterized protein n=1 Tax=Dendrothele bispora (strain CBS 962.96) TaxID=1314807 RepID=A0A4S8L3S0_DENBC|nr:hypothetical protein K435DRAFT_871551 [Dendrothele bispora CBS 962.96]